MTNYLEKQQGDVLLYQSADDGEITVKEGLVLMDGGLQTAVYISLFGGNERDEGLQDTRFSWWGNLMENESKYLIRSRTQYLIQSIPAVPYNLSRINDSVKADLKWMEDEGVATIEAVDTVMLAPKRIKIFITLGADGSDNKFEYEANWEGSQ